MRQYLIIDAVKYLEHQAISDCILMVGTLFAWYNFKGGKDQINNNPGKRR
jgi:endonuclease V-like protein UPF0215 family